MTNVSWLISNPFSSYSSGDFSLAALSVPIDAGANLGESYDDGLSPASSFADSIITIDQDLKGSGWEMGAYVYLPIAGGGIFYYPIHVFSTPNGSIIPRSISVTRGGSQTFFIEPDNGYETEDVLVDNFSVGKVRNYTIDNVTSPKTIIATFKKIVDDKTKVQELPPKIEASEQQISNPPANIESIHIFTQSLSYGSRNNEVRLLQDKLKQLGFFSQKVASNGNFGPATLKAVKDFQLKNKITRPGIYGYGIVGPRTRAALNTK
jgi:hypothetical protein